MAEFDFDRYLEAFNSGQEDASLGHFFTEDLIVESPFGVLQGRDAWIGALEGVHDGVRERLTPRLVVRDGDDMMAELDGEFTASADKPDFMHGPLRRGETLRVRFFAVYRFRDQQITRLALAWWPPAVH